LIAVVAGMSIGPPAFAHAASVAICLSESVILWARGRPLSDAGQGGMNFVAVTVRMPSAIDAASPALSSCQCRAPISPALWQDAQLVSRIGLIAFSNDGPPEATLDCGPVMRVEILCLVGSTAVSFIVSVTSSLVVTRPESEIGPMPKVESLVSATAVACTMPL
jgi:hypothetical protein